MAGEVRVPTILDLRVDPAQLQQLAQILRDTTSQAQALKDAIGGAVGGGGGANGGSGGGGSSIPGGGGGGSPAPGAPGGGSPIHGRAGAGAVAGAAGGYAAGRGWFGRMGSRQIPYPDQGGVIRAAHAIPFVGALAAGAIYSAFHNYRYFEEFENAQAAVAPFARPLGVTTTQGYTPTEALQAQLELSRAAGYGVDAGATRRALGWMRQRGLSASTIGGFARPFAAGAGLGGELGDVTGQDAIGRALGTAVALGFQSARFPEFLDRVARTVESAGERGLRTDLGGLLRLQSRFGATDPSIFAGSRAVAGAEGFAGMRDAALSPGGDPFVQAMLLRRLGGLGRSGVSARQAFVNTSIASRDVNAVANAILAETQGMGPEMQFFYLYQQLGNRMSPEEIDALISGGGGAGLAGQVGSADTLTPGSAASPYLGSARHRAGMAAKRVGIGAKTAPTVRKLESTLIDIEEYMTTRVMEFVEDLFKIIQKVAGAGSPPSLSSLAGGSGGAVTPSYAKSVWAAYAAGKTPPPPPNTFTHLGAPAPRSARTAIRASITSARGQRNNAGINAAPTPALPSTPGPLPNAPGIILLPQAPPGPQSLNIIITDERRPTATAWVDDTGAVKVTAGRV